jgi:hypothetical protein
VSLSNYKGGPLTYGVEVSSKTLGRL